jgi:hypothetical protein
MLAPLLMSGVKELYHLACERVRRLHAITFMAVAVGASQPEVIFFSLATTRFWDDMLYIQKQASHFLRGEAIAAAVARLLGHPAA